MNHILKVFFAALLFATPAYAQSVTQPLKIIVFGDGLLAGSDLRPDQTFAVRLENKLKEAGFEVTVEDMSRPVQTTAMARDRLDQLIGKAPDMVIVELGENDIQRAINQTIIRDNLYKIVFSLHDRSIYTIAMGTTPPASMGKVYVDHVNYTYGEIGKVVPLYPYVLTNIAGHPDMTLADGYHPNPRGVDMMIAGIYSAVDAGLRWRMEVLNAAMRSAPQQQNSQGIPDFEPPLAPQGK